LSALDKLAKRMAAGARPLVAMSASGQLGYGIPLEAFRAGIRRRPDFIGTDMGSIDPGPYYLGAGRMATDPEMTKRDLRLVLTGAREIDVPLLLGTAGTAGAQPHLDETLGMVREIAREEGLHFTLASIRADLSPDIVIDAQRAGDLHPLGEIPDPSSEEIRQSRLVAQMGTEPFARALKAGADVVIAGRSCDTAIYSTIPHLLGYPMGLAVHMAKILECASLCCTPGGRDSILGHLDHDGFVLESLNPERHAKPQSVAAHSLYEQANPFSVEEPEGTLYLDHVDYQAVDEHRTRVAGARWEPSKRLRLKIEGSLWEGSRSLFIAASADPRFIAALDGILLAVEKTIRGLFPQPFRLFPRIYGNGASSLFPSVHPSPAPAEIFIVLECVAETDVISRGVVAAFKQYLLHHGFPGRLSTGGNLAFPITPPELAAGAAYRFSVYHLMDVSDLSSPFPMHIEEL
jgi:hypothetical protein